MNEGNQTAEFAVSFSETPQKPTDMESFWMRRRDIMRLLCTTMCAVGLSGASGTVGAAPSLSLPNGPAKAGFDITRLDHSFYGIFETFHVSETRPLRDALKSGAIANDTALLMIDTADGPLALIVEQMAYHHIAQGRANGRDWLVSFCIVCNTGTRLVPVANGKSTRFETVGIYDGMLVMRDVATGTIWNHITGEALYGPGVGTNLGPVGNVLQMTAKQLLDVAAGARIAISDRTYYAGGRRHGTLEGMEELIGSKYRRPESRAALSGVFAATLGQEDTRRPRMELGLGVWDGGTSRYYPVDRLRLNRNVIVDRLGNRLLLVYLDPDTSTPAALFVNSARARVDGSTVRLDNGLTVSNGMLKDARGKRLPLERPLQVFTRWYGFALTFPGTEIFGEE